MMEERTIILNITRNPSISGWGGFDEWTIDNLSREKEDELLKAIDRMVKRFKGNFTGAD